MKNKLLILSVVVMLGVLPLSAAVKTSETSEREYLRNQGYSEATVDLVYSGKAAANGEKYVTDTERDHARYKYFWPVNWLRKLVIYLDPAMETTDAMHHDIKMTPSVNDL